MRLDIKRCQFKSDKRPWFCLMHVQELVAEKGHLQQIKIMHQNNVSFSKDNTVTQPRQTNNSQLKEMFVKPPKNYSIIDENTNKKKSQFLTSDDTSSS